ncbi:unnamed protein product, partial [Schistosoma curassoni]
MSHSLCEAEIKKFEDSIQYWFLTLPETNEYKFFRKRLADVRKHKTLSSSVKPEAVDNCKSEIDEFIPTKRRRSRWDEETNEPKINGSVKDFSDGSLASAIALAKAAAAAAKTQGTTSNPNQFTGGVVLTPEQAEQIRYQKELQAMQEFILAQKRSKSKEEELMNRIEVIKYEYDSDEDCENGTWEHKLRQAEMEATREWAQKLTEMGHGKHHIGDFLPPDELERFMETFRLLHMSLRGINRHKGTNNSTVDDVFVKQEKFNNRWNRLSFDKIECFGCSPSWPSEQLLKNPIFLFCFYTSCICRYLIGFN